jgi:hypothetical protein
MVHRRSTATTATRSRQPRQVYSECCRAAGGRDSKQCRILGPPPAPSWSSPTTPEDGQSITSSVRAVLGEPRGRPVHHRLRLGRPRPPPRSASPSSAPSGPSPTSPEDGQSITGSVLAVPDHPEVGQSISSSVQSPSKKISHDPGLEPDSNVCWLRTLTTRPPARWL